MKPGSRLSTETAMVSRTGIATDGPFGEAKEVVGGYWFIVARSLREAAEIAAENPCAQYGLTFEIRPLEAERHPRTTSRMRIRLSDRSGVKTSEVNRALNRQLILASLLIRGHTVFSCHISLLHDSWRHLIFRRVGHEAFIGVRWNQQ